MTSPIQGSDDPGWRGALIGLVGLPFLMMSMRREPTGPDGLVGLRGVLCSFISALLLFLVVLLFVMSGAEQTGDAPLWAGITVAVGVFGQVAGRVLERPLVGTTAPEVASSYRQRFFLRLAFAETPALIGFVGVFISGAIWVYVVGLACAAVGFARLAPTRRHLEHDAEQLRADGSPVDLLAALRAPTSPAP